MSDLPKGIEAILSGEYDIKIFTDKVVNTISEYYLIYKSYYDFDEVKFSFIALDCAKKAKNENTFPSYFKYTLESDLFLNEEEELDFEPSPEFIENEAKIMRAYQVAVWDYHDIKKIGETNECINAAVIWAGYPDIDDRIWKLLPSYPVDSKTDREYRDSVIRESPSLVEFNGASYLRSLYYSLSSSIDGQRKEDWIRYLKNWKQGVKLLYKKEIDIYIRNMRNFEIAYDNMFREEEKLKKAIKSKE